MRILGGCLLAVLIGSSVSAGEWPTELAGWFTQQSWERDTAGPILSLDEDGQFDDRHIFAPAVAQENGRFQLWYSGSRGTPGNRVFRLGLATSSDGKTFERSHENPVLEFADGRHSVLTPALLRNADGSVLRENDKLRLWYSSATLGKGGLHTLHESRSEDGIRWSDPSPALMDNVYCPTVLKAGDGYEMWYSDVSRRPWVIRHAKSADGKQWTPSPRPALILDQAWEAEVLVYPTVLKADSAYLMWYGSYDRAIRRETTAIGFAVSLDGEHWYKHPANPVLRPDPERPWESNYVGSGSVLHLADGSFRYWYASRKQPPFVNLYFAINTARWTGPSAERALALMPLPPKVGERGLLATDLALGRTVTVLEVVDGSNAIVRAWYTPKTASSTSSTAAAGSTAERLTFVDLWLRDIDTKGMASDATLRLTREFKVIDDRVIDTTCGGRRFAQLEPVDP
jgi:predicted GH43/DUF377 family glycosyl hydrolase